MRENNLMRLKLNHVNSAILTILSICLILTVGFISGCGDEGDPVSEMMNGDGDKITEPDPTDPDPVDPVVDPDPDPVVSFKDDVNPIIAERCAVGGCHDNVASGGLNLTTYDNFKKGGKSGAAFVAEDADNSLVVKYIKGEKQPQMPIGGNPLNADEIQLFVDWINEGAENN